MTPDRRRAGVLLLAFGGPEALEEVGPFMERLMGRAPTPEMVAGAKEKYRVIGGGSPLPRLVREQAQALTVTLDGAAPVLVGMRYGRPTIAEAVAEARDAGWEKIVGVSLSPYYSAVSTGAYRDALAQACVDEAFEGEVVLVESWASNADFLEALAERLSEVREADDGRYREWPVIFTAHSLPLSDHGAVRYVSELEESVRAVAARTEPIEWRLAYQSKGRAPGEWLGPAMDDVLAELAEGSPRPDGVVVAPVGFTCEHMETLYDLDVEAHRRAEELGLGFVRVPTLGTRQLFIRALADIAGPHLGT